MRDAVDHDGVEQTRKESRQAVRPDGLKDRDKRQNHGK
jgi:hypothetical protein